MIAASMTSFGEVMAWLLLVVLIVGGGIALYANWPRIHRWRRGIKLERAKRLGYYDRTSLALYDDTSLSTRNEREAYRQGWEEREVLEVELEADSAGMIVAQPENNPKKQLRKRGSHSRGF